MLQRRAKKRPLQNSENTERQEVLHQTISNRDAKLEAASEPILSS
jgi:hypothetical protein